MKRFSTALNTFDMLVQDINDILEEKFQVKILMETSIELTKDQLVITVDYASDNFSSHKQSLFEPVLAEYILEELSLEVERSYIDNFGRKVFIYKITREEL